MVLEELAWQDVKSLVAYRPMDRHIGKMTTRCSTRGLREHSLEIYAYLFSGLGGESLKSLHKENTTDGQKW